MTICYTLLTLWYLHATLIIPSEIDKLKSDPKAKSYGPWWCLLSTPTICVRIPLTPTVFSVKIVFEWNENKQKEARSYFKLLIMRKNIL